ncbi:glycosyltransferase [Agrobacterium sp. 22-226-1]
MNRVFYWCGLTVTQPFNTGIQRVTRCLAAELQKRGTEIIPIKWNARKNGVSIINGKEAEIFAAYSGPNISLPDRLPMNLKGEWMIVPEVIVPMVVPGSNPVRWANDQGMKTAAIFYDLIPLKTATDLHAKHLELFAEYWRMFAEADLVLPISKESESDMVWWLGHNGHHIPEVKTVYLAGELPGIPRSAKSKKESKTFNLVSVGSIEPRKNHVAVIRSVLDAREQTGVDIRLTIIGRTIRDAYPELHVLVDNLMAKSNGAITLRESVGDEEMNDILSDADATVFGSWLEGFGLPVLESLWRGLPCICHNGSSIGEIAPGGGTVMVDMTAQDRITDAIIELATSPDQLEELTAEASKRHVKTWAEYADDVANALDIEKIDHTPFYFMMTDYLLRRNL